MNHIDENEQIANQIRIRDEREPQRLEEFRQNGVALRIEVIITFREIFQTACRRYEIKLINKSELIRY